MPEFSDTLDVLRKAGEHSFVVIGGQAVNYWAEQYRRQLPRHLAEAFTFTSKDYDFLGTREAARRLGANLSVEVKVPKLDDNTSTTAAMELDDGIVIQFISHVLGVRSGEIEKHAITVTQGRPLVCFRVMHPLHLLQSRVANVMTLGRRDAHSMRQLEVARYILIAYISDVVSSLGSRQGLKQIKSLYDYARTSIDARSIYDELGIDPAIALREYAGLSETYRTRHLPRMQRTLADDRDRRRRFREARERNRKQLKPAKT